MSRREAPVLETWERRRVSQEKERTGFHYTNIRSLVYDLVGEKRSCGLGAERCEIGLIPWRKQRKSRVGPG